MPSQWKRVFVQDLVGVKEIANNAGVSTPAVINWINRYSDFPPPVVTLGCGPIFQWPQIEKWLAATGRGKEGSYK